MTRFCTSEASVESLNEILKKFRIRSVWNERYFHASRGARNEQKQILVVIFIKWAHLPFPLKINFWYASDVSTMTKSCEREIFIYDQRSDTINFTLMIHRRFNEQYLIYLKILHSVNRSLMNCVLVHWPIKIDRIESFAGVDSVVVHLWHFTTQLYLMTHFHLIFTPTHQFQTKKSLLIESIRWTSSECQQIDSNLLRSPTQLAIFDLSIHLFDIVDQNGNKKKVGKLKTHWNDDDMRIQFIVDKSLKLVRVVATYI